MEEIAATDKQGGQFSEELMSRVEFEFDRAFADSESEEEEPSPQLIIEEADWIAEFK